MDMTILSIAIIFGFYYLKEGLICFGSNKEDSFFKEEVFVTESYIYKRLGIKKKDLKEFLQNNLEIRSIKLNENTYYVKKSIEDYINKLENDDKYSVN